MTETPHYKLPTLQASNRSNHDRAVSTQQSRVGNSMPALPSLRFEVPEAALILRMSRAALYIRISRGAIKTQKDGARTYITLYELERYVAACD